MKKTSSFSGLSFYIPFLIFVLGAASILYHIGSAGLFETSEGRYASVARAMLDSGDWLTPVHNGLKHLTKPPVTYWASALGMKFFGINEFGARFFLAIAAGLTALGCFLIGNALFDLSTGLLAALILCCSMFFQVQFRGLTTDPFLTMFETFMVFAFIKYLQNFRRRQEKRWENIFWFLAGMAMLTKGPPGLLPLLGLIPACLLANKKEEMKSLFKSVSGWVIFVVFGLGWYLILALKTPGLLGYFLLDETINRVASSSHQRSGPFYLFLILLPAGIFPWTSFFIRGLKNSFRRQKEEFAEKLLLFWLFGPLIIFTLSRSKLAAYVLPLLIPVALIAALAAKQIFSGDSEQEKDHDFHVKMNAVLLAIIGFGLLITSFTGILQANVLNSSLRFIGVFWIFLSACLFAQSLYKNQMLAFALICFAAPGFIFFSVPGIKGNEALKPGKYLPSQWLLLKRLGNLPPEQKIINIEEMIEGWYFYTGRNPITWNVSRVTRFDKDKAAQLVLNGPEELNKAVDTNCMLVLRSKDMARVSEILNYDLKLVASEGKWLVTIPERKMGL